MNAPETAWYEKALFSAAFEKLMARAKGLPAPWVLDLMDGDCRCLEHVTFEHGIGCACCADGVGPIRRSGSFSDWPADWCLPLSLILTSGDDDIVVVETEELSAQ